jgi:protein SPA2
MSYRARPPSPSNTNFSGISNYRSESYRPIREREVPAVPQIDSKKVARVHFDELSQFLSSHLAGGQCQSLVHCALGNQTLTSCTPFQRYQIRELVLERSLRGLLASNSKNYPQMSTTSSSAETPDQKVGLVPQRGKPKIFVSDY